MSKSRIILVGGGARSGKSAFALELARSLGTQRLFVATAQPGDAEMAERIRRHQQSRGDGFTTLEEPLAIEQALLGRQTRYDVLVLDCVTLWLSNMLLQGMDADAILLRVDGLIAALAGGPGHAVIITNEVGMGLVPETALGRVFRDVAGSVHQRLSAAADEVYFAVLGAMLRIKPAPAFISMQAS
jgi:adenosylcobinamide kinase/adenosylcobinamide-phosphate guanylyltransferase